MLQAIRKTKECKALTFEGQVIALLYSVDTIFADAINMFDIITFF